MDELVKRLRTECTLPFQTLQLMREAADAIEQLSNAGSAYGRGWTLGYDAGREESKPRWIPVAERLPAAERKHYWVCTDTGYQCECRWTNNLFGFGESGEWGWSIFDIPQYQKVVAWMPLPEPYEPQKEQAE